MEFKLHAPYEPTGDQPEAIKELVEGFQEGNQFQTLLGVTGSGKTFTMANVIAQLNKPTLIISHNKTLAAQLYGEMKEFFPENAVEYFVSYYDYYQPEAYVPQSDTYIAKDSAVNDEIDKLRLSATAALAERKDVIIVASVSCIYGIGSPDDYMNMMVSLRPGMEIDRDDVIKGLIDMQYTRNEMDFKRGTFRVHGDVLEIFPANNTDTAVRVEFFGDEIDRITEVDVLTGEIKCLLQHIAIFPASHYVVPQEKMNAACDRIEAELEERVKYFKGEDKLLEAQRIAERTNFDIEMMKETGFCSGIENYSRHLAGRAEGEMPETLIDYFPDDFLIIVDESHITIPQVRGMYAGDRSRKTTLVDYGFRLPSALDNRPLNFEEFESKIDQMLFVFDCFYRNGFTAGIRSGNYQSIVFFAERNINGNDLIFIDKRVSRLLNINYSVGIYHRFCGFHFICKMSLCKDNIKVDTSLITRLNSVGKIACLGREFKKYSVNLLSFSASEHLNLVICLNNGNRLNKDCRTG